MARFRDYHPEQPELFGYVDPDAQLPRDHIARFVDELVDLLDLTALEQRYSDFGSKGYDPRLHLKVFFLGYIEGVTSSRKTMHRCHRDLAFIYLCRGQKPDFRTIARFRRVHRQDIYGLFAQVLRVARDMGMARLGRVVIDSTTMKANASRGATRRVEDLDEELRQLDDYLCKLQENDAEEDETYGGDRSGEELPEGLIDEEDRRRKLRKALDKQRKLKQVQERLENSRSKTINTTDPDSYFRRDGATKQNVTGYGAQIAISEDGLVIASDVHPENNDPGALLPIVDQVISNLDNDLQQTLLLADSGYFRTNFIEELGNRGIESLIPDGLTAQRLNGKEIREPREGFQYDRETDSYICPANQRLGFRGVTTSRTGDRHKQQRVYSNAEACGACALRDRCVGTKFRYKSVKVVGDPGKMEGYRERFEDPENQRKYRVFRKSIEKVFGHTKGNLGMRQFRCRGLEMVKAEWALICTAYNILRMHGKQGRLAGGG